MANAPALNFVVLYVSNLEEATRYYTQKLGFTYVVEQSGPDFHYLKGEGGIDFGLNQAGENTPPAGQAEVYFTTPDIEQLRRTLSERGAQVSEILHPPFGDIFSVQVPDNHQVIMAKFN